MAGLSRTKNLSERNLNLKTALQKLYRPGIENDIELFSLSSSITSTILSGPEVLPLDAPLSQIYAVESQKILVNRNGVDVVLDRTFFKTRYFTFTNDNLVYFSKFDLTLGEDDLATAPVYSSSGSIPSVNLVYGGRGFYFINPSGGTFDGQSQITLNNVILRGGTTLSSTARGRVVFEREDYSELDSPTELEEFDGYTPGSQFRYKVKSIELIDRGAGYIIPEDLSIIEDISYEVNNPPGGTPTSLTLKKHRGTIFALTEPIIKTQLYFYRIVSATSGGFFLFDDEKQNYLYLDTNVSQLTNSSIEIKRNDFIRVENLLQFKFAGSRIYLDGYGDPYSAGESISGELGNLAASVDNNYNSVRLAIQNTKKPTLSDSPDNYLGYVYNEFVGRDLVIWQRVVMRDQDYLLDPGTGVTADLLRTSVDNFELDISGNKVKVPGLFIRVGNEYFRAFSTTDKPFYQAGDFNIIENPKLNISNSSANYGALSAESKLNGVWYSYSTKISELAQRIDPNGVNGAFYFHRQTAPTIRTISMTKGPNNTPSTIRAVPLFTTV